jgi:hypothetical protein
MSAFGPPAPQFDLYYGAVDRQTGVIVTVGESAPGVLADASEKTGYPKIVSSLARLAGRSMTEHLRQIDSIKRTETLRLRAKHSMRQTLT